MTDRWHAEVSANWTLNEMKQKWHEAYNKGGNYQKWAKAAEELRAQMRKAGISEFDIMQVSDDMISKEMVDKLAQSSTTDWIQSDPFGLKVFVDMVKALIPTSEDIPISVIKGPKVSLPISGKDASNGMGNATKSGLIDAKDVRFLLKIVSKTNSMIK